MFEASSAETFIAGIASTLIDSGTVGPEYLRILKRDVIVGTALVMPDGKHIELSAASEILHVVRLVDELRLECLRVAGS